jgi:hypothetical protein
VGRYRSGERVESRKPTLARPSVVLASTAHAKREAAKREQARWLSLFIGGSMTMDESCMIDAGHFKLVVGIIPRNAMRRTVQP